jgi:hypothetical protein
MKRLIKKIFFLIFLTFCFCNVAYSSQLPELAIKIVDRKIAILLMIMQFLQYIVPIFYFIIKLIIDKKEKKHIVKYGIKAIFIFLVFIIIGLLIVEFSTSRTGYANYSNCFKYNWQTIYYK